MIARAARVTVARTRAAAWAAGALRETRAQLRARPLEDVVVPQPPPLSPHGALGVRAALRLRRASCLERSLVLQRWLAAHGERRDVVIGVSAPGEFRAHAWLDGEPAPDDQGFRELSRMAP